MSQKPQNDSGDCKNTGRKLKHEEDIDIFQKKRDYDSELETSYQFHWKKYIMMNFTHEKNNEGCQVQQSINNFFVASGSNRNISDTNETDNLVFNLSEQLKYKTLSADIFKIALLRIKCQLDLKTQGIVSPKSFMATCTVLSTIIKSFPSLESPSKAFFLFNKQGTTLQYKDIELDTFENFEKRTQIFWFKSAIDNVFPKDLSSDHTNKFVLLKATNNAGEEFFCVEIVDGKLILVEFCQKSKNFNSSQTQFYSRPDRKSITIGKISEDQINYIQQEIFKNGKLNFQINDEKLAKTALNSVTGKKGLALFDFKFQLFENFEGKVYTIADTYLEDPIDMTKSSVDKKSKQKSGKESLESKTSSFFYLLPKGVNSNESYNDFNSLLKSKGLKVLSMLSPVTPFGSNYSGQTTSWTLYQKDVKFQSLERIFPCDNLIPLLGIFKVIDAEVSDYSLVFTKLQKLLEVYFEKYYLFDEQNTEKAGFWDIFGFILIDIFTKKNYSRVFTQDILDNFISLYYKITDNKIKKSYMTQILFNWEVWDTLSNEVFDGFCIQLSKVMTDEELNLDYSSLLGNMLRFLECKNRNQSTPKQQQQINMFNNPLQLFLAFVAKTEPKFIKKVIQVFQYHFQTSKSVSNEVLFQNVFYNIQLQITQKELLDLDPVNIIKVLVKKNNVKIIELKTIILEIISIILKPLKEYPEWIDSSFLACLGDYLVDEVWNLTSLKNLKRNNDCGKSDDQNSSKLSYASNSNNFTKSECKNKPNWLTPFPSTQNDNLSPSKFLNIPNKGNENQELKDGNSKNLLQNDEITLELTQKLPFKANKKNPKKSLLLDTNLINLTSQITFQMPKSVAIRCEKSFNLNNQGDYTTLNKNVPVSTNAPTKKITFEHISAISPKNIELLQLKTNIGSFATKKSLLENSSGNQTITFPKKKFGSLKDKKFGNFLSIETDTNDKETQSLEKTETGENTITEKDNQNLLKSGDIMFNNSSLIQNNVSSAIKNSSQITNYSTFEPMNLSKQIEGNNSSLSFAAKKKRAFLDKKGLTLDTDEINDMFTFGGEKGTKKVTSEDNDKLIQEVKDMAKKLVDFMDSANKESSEQTIQNFSLFTPKSDINQMNISHMNQGGMFLNNNPSLVSGQNQPMSMGRSAGQKSAPISVKGMGKIISFDTPFITRNQNKESQNIISEISASQDGDSQYNSSCKNSKSKKINNDDDFFVNSWMMILFNTNNNFSNSKEENYQQILKKVTETLISLITLFSVSLKDEKIVYQKSYELDKESVSKSEKSNIFLIHESFLPLFIPILHIVPIDSKIQILTLLKNVLKEMSCNRQYIQSKSSDKFEKSFLQNLSQIFKEVCQAYLVQSIRFIPEFSKNILKKIKIVSNTTGNKLIEAFKLNVQDNFTSEHLKIITELIQEIMIFTLKTVKIYEESSYSRIFLSIINSTQEYIEDFGKFIKVDSSIFTPQKHKINTAIIESMFLDRKLIIENQINQNESTAQAPLE